MSDKKEVIEIKFTRVGFRNATQQVKEKYIHTETHCPRCGEKKVWEDTDSWDCEANATHHVCTACAFDFYFGANLDRLPSPEDILRAKLISEASV